MKKLYLRSYGNISIWLVLLIVSEALWSNEAYSGQENSLLTLFKNALINQEILLSLALAIIAGFLTALSPCVYPLIPITISIMGARNYQSPLQGFFIALAYVFGMSLVFTALGAIFASLGLVFGASMQSPGVLVNNCQ